MYAASCVPANVHSADGWERVLKPIIVRYQEKVLRIYFRADAAFAMPGGRPVGGATPGRSMGRGRMIAMLAVGLIAAVARLDGN